jgi:clan AA aspartic protease
VIHGRVSGLQARASIPFRRSGQPDVAIEFVVDTGFEGALTLPPAAVTALGLPYLIDIDANLADDTRAKVAVHEATIEWDGAEVAVAVLAMGRRPLLGTALLDGRRLSIEFLDGGDVRIEPYP